MSINVYQIVTDRIMADLRKGTIPWEKPWTGLAPENGGAFNRVNKKPYSYMNQMLLGKGGEWASFKQWSTLGGKIRKGEKASVVVFWKMVKVSDSGEGTEGTEAAEGKAKYVPILKYMNVFHIDQVEGVEPLEQKAVEKSIDPVEEAEAVKAGYLERETHLRCYEEKGDKAYYSPVMDKVVTPLRGQFKTPEGYYGTLFHELVHSTGHKSRLDRFNANSPAHFGSCDYSKEELVAEMGSAFLLAQLGMSTERENRNTSAYIQSWLKVLQDDSRFVVSAASRAQKAVEYIRNEKEEEK